MWRASMKIRHLHILLKSSWEYPVDIKGSAAVAGYAYACWKAGMTARWCAWNRQGGTAGPAGRSGAHRKPADKCPSLNSRVTEWPASKFTRVCFPFSSPVLLLFFFKTPFKKVPAPARSSYRSRDGGREIDSAESVPGGAALKSCQGCRSRREGEGGGNKVNIGMGIRRQELILFHEKSTLSPLSLPPRISQPRVSPGFIFLFLPPRLRISAMGFFLSPVEGALSYVAEGNLNNSILLPLFEGVGRQFLKINHSLTGNCTTLLVFTQKKWKNTFMHANKPV